jgi:teichuronic acid biosynthesis glycosyltransferase TuaH
VTAGPQRPAGQRQLIWMAGVSWDAIQGTDRHLVAAMAPRARILWVDPPVSLARQSVRDTVTGRSLRPRVSVIDDRVTRLTPAGPPGFTRPGVRALTAALVRRQVRSVIRRRGIAPHAVVSTHLENLLGYWGDEVVNVLYGTDDYVAGAELMGLSARHQRKQEVRALARANVVAAVSPELAARWARLGADPVVIPNGCWPASGETRPAAPAVQDLPRPVVGLIGQLSDRIDLEVLEAVAGAGYSLLIVGPLDPRWGGERFAQLVRQPHVRYVGQVPSTAVPRYLAAIDVGITPYRDTPFNRASFPLKTLEYLGAGVPVVSADLPAARWLHADLARGYAPGAADAVMTLARSTAEFAAGIRAITAGDDYAGAPDAPQSVRHRARADQCIAFVAEHSWDRRADALASAIGLG